MPVIGRLDGQVDAVIIKPISGRRRQEDSPAPAHSREAPEPPAPAERDPSQTPDRDESSAAGDELPVWLL